jgi:hypothetical protein
MRVLFAALLTLQFIVVILHDLVDIPGWTHGRQVRAVVGERKLWLATLVNSLFPGLAVGFALYYWNRPLPGFAINYWMMYCGITFVSAITMWYIPYFFGAKEATKLDYSRMYAGTRQILPARGDHPRPNLLHICFHVLFVVNFCLATLLWLRRS